jgi:hypothetical protein
MSPDDCSLSVLSALTLLHKKLVVFSPLNQPLFINK